MEMDAESCGLIGGAGEGMRGRGVDVLFVFVSFLFPFFLFLFLFFFISHFVFYDPRCRASSSERQYNNNNILIH